MNTGDQTIADTKTFSSTISGSIDGNAATSSKLASAVTIGGVSFDGSSDINYVCRCTIRYNGNWDFFWILRLECKRKYKYQWRFYTWIIHLTSGSSSAYLTSEDSSLDLDGWMYCRGLINWFNQLVRPLQLYLATGNTLNANQISLVTTGSTRVPH